MRPDELGFILSSNSIEHQRMLDRIFICPLSPAAGLVLRPLARRPTKDRTPYPFPRMPRGLGVRKIPLPQIIFVFVNNEGASQQVTWRNSVDQIAVRGRF